MSLAYDYLRDIVLNKIMHDHELVTGEKAKEDVLVLNKKRISARNSLRIDPMIERLFKPSN